MPKRLLLVFSFLALPTASWAQQAMPGSPELPPNVLEALVKETWHRNITDADFFGVFKNGKWEEQPMIDYTYSPTLKKVEEAAKSGDYARASSELLLYFRARDFTPPPAPSSWDREKINLWKDNILGFEQQEDLVTVFDLQQEPELHALNVLKSLNKGMVTFELMGRHKNGAVSFVDSRKSDQPPILELLSKDGTTTRLQAVADTFIRAGKFGQTNYGTAKTLEVCNSGLKMGQPFDDDTRQALIEFDLSKINPADVKTAELKLTAWSSEPGQRLILFHSVPTLVNEAKDTWDNSVAYIYSWEGLPGGVVWDNPPNANHQFVNWLRRLYWFPDTLALAMNSSDPEEQKVPIRLLRSFIGYYPSGHKDNNLNAGNRAIAFSHFLPYLFKVPACTPSDCVEILKFVVRDNTILDLDEDQLKGSYYNNIGMTFYTGLIEVSDCFPELADSKRWKEDGNNRFADLLSHLVLNDGGYCEHTFGYPFGVLNQLLDLLDYYKRSDLKAPDELSQKTQQLARYLMFCSMPNGLPPEWGEGWAKDSTTYSSIKRAAEVFNDPELKWWTSKGQVGHEPQVTTVSYPEVKIGVLRDSWKPDANVLFVSSRVGGGHYNVDQNAIQDLYAYGRELLNNTGMTSYDGRYPAFDYQHNQTRSHNTVEVDEKGFPRLETVRKDFGWNPEGPCASSVLNAAHASFFEGWGGGYPNVRHERRILSLKEAGLYFVADFLQPNDGQNHIYDQCWHIYPLNQFKTDAQTCEVWTEDANQANLEIKPLYPRQLQLLIRSGFNAVPLMQTSYPSFRQQVSGNAEFLTLLAPTRPGAPARSLQAKLLDTPQGIESAEIATAQGRGLFFVSYLKATAPVKVGSVETDGRCAYVQFGLDGRVLWSVLVDGTILKVNGQETSFELMTPLPPPALPPAPKSPQQR